MHPRSAPRPVVVSLEDRTTPTLFAVGSTFPALGTDPGGQYALNDIVTGDFNGDGVQDAVAVNTRTGTFQVFLNKGTGQFAPGVVLSDATAGQPAAAVVADFTGDGKLDVVTTFVDLSPGGSATDAVLVWLGKGDGTFTAAPLAPGGVLRLEAWGAAAGDFNGDGQRDLVVVSPDGVTGFGKGGFAVLLGNGAGVFTAVTDPLAPQFLGFDEVFAADFDADGKLDFASADSPAGGGAQVVFGAGTGAAAQVVTLTAPPGLSGGGQVASATAGDFTGDGNPDLLVAYQNNELYLSANQGGRQFAGPALKYTGAGNAYEIRTGDFNRDGKPDIVLAEMDALLTAGQASVLLGDGAGAFAAATGNPFAATGGAYKAAVGEFTGDGNPDVLVGNFATDTLQLLSNTTPRPTSIALTAPGAAEDGQPVGLTATVTATGAVPVGTVTFKTGAVVLGSAAVGADGKAVFTTSTLPVGADSLTAEFVGGGFQTAVSAPAVVQVTPAVASHFVVAGFPATITTGIAGTVTITAVNAFGKVAAGYGGTAHWSSTDAAAGLPADYTFGAADAGVKTFVVTFRTPGTQSLTATDSAITGTQTGIAVVRAFAAPGPFAAGADRGGGLAAFYGPDGKQTFALAPFVGSAGGVRTAVADFTGDGVADLVVGTGPGTATLVRILDGTDQSELFAVVPFEASFTGGVFVAAGDLDGDGTPDLVVSPDEGGGPRVRVYSGKGFAQLADFLGIDDPAFRGGARVAVGDVNGDGTGDLVVAAGFNGGPRVAGFDGRSLRAGPTRLFADFLTFEPALRNGSFVAVGDLDGDGFAEVIAGGGPGGGPRVTAFSGKALLGNQQTVLADFFAGAVTSRGGVRLAVKDLDGDARADLLTGSGTGAGSRVTAYLGKALAATGGPLALDFDAFPGFAGGVFVG